MLFAKSVEVVLGGKVQGSSANIAPEFADTRTTRYVPEDAESTMETKVNVGEPVKAKDTATDTLEYTLGGADKGLFTINAAGQIQVKVGAMLDHETEPTLTVTVTATDPHQATDTITVTINVTDVDEMPVLIVAGLAISGPSSASYAEDGRDAVATYTASGPDAASARWSLGGDDAGRFNIPNGMLMFKTAPNYENAERTCRHATTMYMVTVIATDGTYTPTREVTVTVTNVNEAPKFGSATTTRSVEENTAAGEEHRGEPVAATDADNDTLTYTLGGDDAASFDIDSATGQIMTLAALDFEAKASYTVDVTATDDGRESDTIAVTINVTEVNEAPEFDSPTATRSVEENTAAGVNIGDPVAAADANTGDTLTYTLGGTDVASFAITRATGQLRTSAALDFEMEASYIVTVTASDGKDSDTVTVTITVTNMDEMGMVTLSAYAAHGWSGADGHAER